jgi:single-strand DNA-binding protein
MNISKVSLIGKVAKPPDSHTLSDGQAMARFVLAIGYAYPKAKGTGIQKAIEHHNILAWGKLAEIIGRYLKKGSKVYVEGRPQNRLWKDASGKQMQRTEIVADELILLGNKQEPDTHENM